jgi:hypothetical protein
MRGGDNHDTSSLDNDGLVAAGAKIYYLEPDAIAELYGAVENANEQGVTLARSTLTAKRRQRRKTRGKPERRRTVTIPIVEHIIIIYMDPTHVQLHRVTPCGPQATQWTRS